MTLWLNRRPQNAFRRTLPEASGAGPLSAATSFGVWQTLEEASDTGRVTP